MTYFEQSVKKVSYFEMLWNDVPPPTQSSDLQHVWQSLPDTYYGAF